MDTRRIVAVGLVAAMLLLAGCSGLIGDNGDDPEPDIDDTNGLDDGLSEPEPHPDSEITATDIEAHEEALQDAGNFSATQTVATTYNGETADDMSFTISFAVDTETDHILQSESIPSANITRYTDGNTTYQMADFGGDVSYDMASEPYNEQGFGVQPANVELAMAGSMVPLDETNYVETGTGTVNGVDATVYEVTNEEALDALQAQFDQSPEGDIDVSDFTVLLHVDDDGIIREQNLSITLNQGDEEITQEITHTITDIGTTTVDEPEWLENAEGDDEGDDTGDDDTDAGDDETGSDE